MLRFDPLLVGLSLLTVLAGCSKDQPKPPLAPGGKGAFVAAGGPGKADSGPADEDSGAPIDAAIELDASTLTVECVGVNPGDYVNGSTTPDGMLLTGATAPADFVITRASAAWDTMGCIRPVIVIELSDGKCPDGRGHKLDIVLDAEAIDGMTPTILTGQNTLVAEPDDKGIRVRYTRPMSLMPAGAWGSCAGAPGTLELVGEPATTAGTRLQGRFTLDLASCNGSAAADQFVDGTFNVELRRGRDDVCPK